MQLTLNLNFPPFEINRVKYPGLYFWSQVVNQAWNLLLACWWFWEILNSLKTVSCNLVTLKYKQGPIFYIYRHRNAYIRREMDTDIYVLECLMSVMVRN